VTSDSRLVTADSRLSRFLIVRLGALGDVVHAIPVAAALRRAWPEARIDWLVSARHHAILDLVPVLTDRLLVNDRGPGEGDSVLRMLRRLRGNRYDVAIDLQGLIKSAMFARLSGARRVIGFAGAHARESAAAWLYTDRYDPGGGGVRDAGAPIHVVRLNLGVLGCLGLTAGEPEFPIAVPESAVAADVAARSSGRYALLNPGAAWPNKRWPPSRFAALARVLRDRYGLRAIVLWGPGERPVAETVAAESAGAAEVSAATSVADLVALARSASLLVSGDTGPMHIAAAVGTPIVGIFGPTRPARNGPWRADDVTVSRYESCECHHLRRCRREAMCVAEIGVDEIAAAVDRRLAARERARA
jgi:lipopolysaccharide heptosyltransferase I